jgi:hypothetical protein
VTDDLLPRFADPEATVPVDLGPCRCAGSPHERDTATVRAEIGDGELRSALSRGGFAGEGGFDGGAADDESIARFVLAWTFTDARGRPVPISRQAASLLDEATRSTLLDAIASAVGARAGPLPNGSGARSPDSSPASASRTHRTPTPR